MSIKGSSYRWFHKALDRGDLATVRSDLADLPPLTLENALAVALLICNREPENAERAAVRWLIKLLERPGVTLAELREALDAFVVLAEDADGAEAALRHLTGEVRRGTG